MSLFACARNSVFLALGLLGSISLAGCGGGGGGGGGGTRTGSLSGLQIEGLRYVSGEELGEIDSSGEFLYESRSPITFKIGDVELGTVSGSDSMTLMDICGYGDLPLTLARAGRAFRFDRSFWRLCNVAVLLALIDQDANPRNGIVIPDQVHGLLSNKTLPFYLYPIEFARDLSLRTLRRDGLVAGIWPGPGRSIPATERVLDALYESMGVEHQFYQTSTEEVDANPGPIIDFDSTKSHSFNAFGQRTETRSDGNGDGSVDSISTRTYDANGNEDSHEVRNGANDLQSRWVSSYNDNGELIEQTEDQNGDGVVNTVFSYSVDALGNTTGHTTTDVATNVVGSRSIAQFTPAGVPMLHEFMRYDNAGVLTRTHRTVYNARGHTVRTELILPGLAPREINHSVVDPRGNVTEYRQDQNGDGNANRVTYSTYDALGQKTESRIDSDGDGTVDTTSTTTYRPDGVEARYTVRDESSNAVTRDDRYGFDARGNRVIVTDAITDAVVFGASYNAGDNPEVQRNLGSMGNVDNIRRWTHDANGWPATQSADRDDDGSIQIYVEYNSEAGSWWSVLNALPII